jgi:hypothetical protein
MAATVLSGAQVSPSGYPGPQSLARLPRGYLAGLIIGNNGADLTNDIDITDGECRDETNSFDIRLSAPITKQLDVAWAAGTGGGRDTAIAIADGTWHVFAIAKADGTADALMSSSLTAPTMPSGFVYKRRIASIVRYSGVIKRFRRLGDYVEFIGGEVTHASASTGASATFGAILGVLVPGGIKFLCNLQISSSHNTSASYSTAYDPDVVAMPYPNMYTAVPNVGHMFNLQIVCKGDATIAITTGPQAGTFTFNVTAMGYWDFRDKEK